MDRWSQGPAFSAHAHEQGWCLGRGLAWVLTCDPTLGSARSGEQNHTSACQGLLARDTLHTAKSTFCCDQSPCPNASERHLNFPFPPDTEQSLPREGS